jgi:hypothetical protein
MQETYCSKYLLLAHSVSNSVSSAQDIVINKAEKELLISWLNPITKSEK